MFGAYHLPLMPTPISPQQLIDALNWRYATKKTGKNVFAGSPLAPTEVYGGQESNRT